MSSSRRTATIESLPPGDVGTFYTLSQMAELVRRDVPDPELRDYAEQLVASVQPHDFSGEVEEVFDHVKLLPYRRHPVDVQRVLDARAAIASGYLDCVSKSVLLATLLGALGHITRFAILRQSCSDCEFDHVYIEVLLNGRWVALDPTPDERSGGAKPMGWETKAQEKRVYPIWPGTVPKSLSDACCGGCASGGACSSPGGSQQGLGIIDPVIGGAIVMGASMLIQQILGIFQKHGQRVETEDQVSGAWQVQGPYLIDQIKKSYAAGQITIQEAFTALDTLEQQFRITVQPISKLKGHFGFLPNVNEPRPSNNCNWACGTSWDLHQELLEIKADMEANPPGGELDVCVRKPWKPKCGQQTAIVVPPTGGPSSSSPYLIAALALGAIVLVR